MIRKTTVAALVLSTVPAALALSLFSGTAQAEDTPWRHGHTVTGKAPAGHAVIAGDDTPWSVRCDDTPWSRGITTSGDDTPWN